MTMEQPSGLVAEVAPTWDRPIVLVPTFASLGLVGGLFPSFSLMANLYVVVLGGVMMWLGLSSRVIVKRPSPVRLPRAASWWLLPAFILVAMEVTNFLLGSTHAHPTLSRLADPTLARYSARSLGYFAWLGGFWGLVRR